MQLSEKERSDQQEWDIYWSRQTKTSNKIYDLIAFYYRKWILSKFLNHYIRKYFKKADKVLHAGCGGGQVDEYIRDYISIEALDISTLALEKYLKNNGDQSKVQLGSIFSLPYEDHSFDGIYNLGVMEHFSETEIQNILIEFRRVLKPNGSILLFWPPTYGLSVFVLDIAHWILNKFLGKSIQLHPTEISRIQSREFAKRIIERAGFKGFQYHFGLRDLCSQVVLFAGN